MSIAWSRFSAVFSLMSSMSLIAALGTSGCSSDATVAPGTDGGLDSSPTADGSPSGDTGPALTSAEFCSRLAARATACGGSSGADTCANTFDCDSTVIKPGPREVFLRCVSGSDCINADQCVAEASKPYASDPVVTKYISDCMAKRTSCSAEGVTFSDDNCGGDFGLYVDAVQAKAQSCIVGACADIVSCFKGLASDVPACAK